MPTPPPTDPHKYIPPGVLETAGRPGYNEYGIPLHACNGYRHDEHYWAWIRFRFNTPKEK